MILISYNVNSKYHPKLIELCGWFRDLEHFEAFRKVEHYRGCIVRNYRIIKEYK